MSFAVFVIDVIGRMYVERLHGLDMLDRVSVGFVLIEEVRGVGEWFMGEVWCAE